MFNTPMMAVTTNFIDLDTCSNKASEIVDIFSKKYIESILERRDQVLKTYNTLTN